MQAREMPEDLDMEELQLELEEKSDEVEGLKRELRATKLRAQETKLRLRAARHGASAERAATQLPQPLAPPNREAQQRRVDIQRFFSWLAGIVDLGSAPEVFFVGVGMAIGGRGVQLGRMAQWRLPGSPGGRLRLSVPECHAESVLQVLVAAKANGGKVDDAAAERLTAEWEISPGHFQPQDGGTEPMVILPHKHSPEAIHVATWLPRSLSEAQGRQEHLPAPAAQQPAPALGRPRLPSTGDQVEVQYEGDWRSGEVVAVDEERAQVRCDLAKGLALVISAPLAAVRRSQIAAPAAPAVVEGDGVEASAGGRGVPQVAGHRRTRSAFY